MITASVMKEVRGFSRNYEKEVNPDTFKPKSFLILNEISCKAASLCDN